MNRAERRRQFRSTGIKQEVKHKFHIPPDRFPEAPPGKHMWTYVAMYHCSDPDTTATQHLDIENLITVEGPGCYVCEQPYTRETADRPCPGEPK